MLWEEDPRVHEGIWRFFGGTIVLITVLAIAEGVANHDFGFVWVWLTVLVVSGLTFAVTGVVGGLIMRGLFSAGDLWRWLIARLLSRSKH